MAQAFWIGAQSGSTLRFVDSGGIIHTPTLTGVGFTFSGFNSVSSLAADTLGNLYVVDPSGAPGLGGSGTGVVYKIDSTNHISRVAGNFGGSGPLGTVLAYAFAVCCDSRGNVFISTVTGASSNSPKAQVLAINTQATTQTIFGVSIAAGDIAVIVNTAGTFGYSGDSGTGLAAQINNAEGLVVDSSGNLLIGDTGFGAFHTNATVRKLNSSGSIITTVAGGGASVTDNILATSTRFNNVDAITADKFANFYVSDTHAVRAVNTQATTQTLFNVSIPAGFINSIAGTPLSGSLEPIGLTVAPTGDLYFCDFGHTQVKKIDASTGSISVVAGTGSSGTTGDGGPATSATLESPFSFAFQPAGLAAPAISPASGSYALSVTVTVTPDANATATYYTTDGSTPSPTNGTLYTSPFTLSVLGSHTVKAMSVAWGFADSPVAEADYTLTTAIGLSDLLPMTNRIWHVGEDFVSRVSQSMALTAIGSWTLTSQNGYVTFNGKATLSGSGNATVTVAIADDSDFPPGYRGRARKGVYSDTVTGTAIGGTATQPVTINIGYGDFLDDEGWLV